MKLFKFVAIHLWLKLHESQNFGIISLLVVLVSLQQKHVKFGRFSVILRALKLADANSVVFQAQFVVI